MSAHLRVLSAPFFGSQRRGSRLLRSSRDHGSFEQQLLLEAIELSRALNLPLFAPPSRPAWGCGHPHVWRFGASLAGTPGAFRKLEPKGGLCLLALWLRTRSLQVPPSSSPRWALVPVLPTGASQASHSPRIQVLMASHRIRTT